MSKKVPSSADTKDKVEITVSTYWPTKIIKSINIKDLTQDYSNSVTLDRGQARYLFDQLAALYNLDHKGDKNSD